MKWAALVLILFTVVALTGWLRTNPRQAHLAWSLLTLLPFVLDPFHLIIAPYAIPMWAGYVKGWEVSLVDAVALGILLGMRGRWPKMALVLPFIAYLVAITLAVIQARFPMYALAYPIQFLRVFLVFLAAARVAQTQDGQKALLTGLVAGISIQAGYASWDRANGVFQTGGSLGHQNLLGFVSHMALMPALGMVLARRAPIRALLGVCAGIIVVILTGSRATILLAASMLTLTILLSTVIRFSGQKIALAIGGFVLLTASAPFAFSAIEKRMASQAAGLTEKDEQRVAFERAARLIVSENPMGIGPNHYVFVSITEGYADRAGVNWSAGNRAAHVHESYLLVAAETGYFGLFAMIALLASSLWYAFATAIRFRREPEADILIGMGCGLLAICLHALAEWMFAVYVVQYVFAANLGLIVGLRSYLIRKSQIDLKAKPSFGATPTRVGQATALEVA
ncbi:O-antigen ligase family protein [Sphingomonas glaciei]|uniref:O-antigen ligase family protein n=1 Tax=Sphingomonas glaciei TaxID=2938948 RepID=A0ABY5MS70_9SPHN|nr:O-antigen ligase family protein [Sphingomonas glaciei]UUR06968.1 O-antigen ligase family protein [Sphingomonas glaciei]